jgi:uncharacterized protein YbjQ (UPF0145 family)
MFTQYFYIKRLLLLVPAFVSLSCTKLVEIPEPKDTVTTSKIFNNDMQAKGAMVSVYSTMINGDSGFIGFGCGLTTMMTGLSADELKNTGGGTYDQFNRNMLDARDGAVAKLWITAYRAIYGANAVVEGIEASQAPTLHAQVRTELTAEAKFTRAFCYFYLVNLYGDVPLALTTDFNKLVTMARTPKLEVYQQMVKDLQDAVNGLPGDYTAGAGERIRPNKWAAKSLLARVYLYLEDYDKAAVQANDVISQTDLYQLETTDLNRVFLKNSTEAIWQLAQSPDAFNRGNSTPEGYTLLPNPIDVGSVSFEISPSLSDAFEPGDLRRSIWIGTSFFKSGSVTTALQFPYKYKTGRHNMAVGQPPSEYYMVFRLAEQYLIRAEARALLGQTNLAITDLNALRNRAGLQSLSTNLTKEQAIIAVAKERQTELFTEWGHRWFDLKRTGKASAVLSAIPIKQPWAGDYQLLYPIPADEISRDHFLAQNPNY